MKPYSLSHKTVSHLTLAVFLFALLFLWFKFSPNRSMTWNYPDSQFYAATLLRGDAPFSEISQDAYGFRALVYRWNAYLPLDEALPDIHENWFQPTTHPPTAFLLAAPVAFLSNTAAATLWSWLCLLALLVSLKLHGFDWPESIGFTLLSLLWLPTMGSLGQLTPIWLLGVSLAYVFRNRNPFLAGVFIAFAAMTKYLPGLLLILFVLKKKWTAVYSFALVYGCALGLIYLLSPSAFNQYFQANETATLYFIEKSGGFLFSAFRSYGLLGLAFSAAFLFMILFANWKEFNTSAEISTKAWMIVSLLAVALLPIAWGYSFFPLYPGMLLLSKQKKPARLFGILGLIFCSIIPVVGMIFYGLGLAWPDDPVSIYKASTKYRLFRMEKRT